MKSRGHILHRWLLKILLLNKKFYRKKSTNDDHNDIYDILLKYETNNASTYEASKAFLEESNWKVKQNRRGEFLI